MKIGKLRNNSKRSFFSLEKLHQSLKNDTKAEGVVVKL